MLIIDNYRIPREPKKLNFKYFVFNEELKKMSISLSLIDGKCEVNEWKNEIKPKFKPV